MILLFGQFVYCGKVVRLNPYKRRLPSDMTFVDVLRYICAGNFLYVTRCIKVSMCFIYVCFVTYLSCKLIEKKCLSKTNGYVILIRNCYL